MSIIADTLRKIEEKHEAQVFSPSVVSEKGLWSNIKKNKIDSRLVRAALYVTGALLFVGLISGVLIIRKVTLSYFSQLTIPSLSATVKLVVNEAPVVPVTKKKVPPVPGIKKEAARTYPLNVKSNTIETVPENMLSSTGEALPVLRLGGVMIGRGESLAVINGIMVKEGDMVAGVTVLKISGNKVTYLYHDKEFEVETF